MRCFGTGGGGKGFCFFGVVRRWRAVVSVSCGVGCGECEHQSESSTIPAQADENRGPEVVDLDAVEVAREGGGVPDMVE